MKVEIPTGILVAGGVVLALGALVAIRSADRGAGTPAAPPPAAGDPCAEAGHGHGHDGEDRLRGRDFVRLGEYGTRSGILKTEHDEWFLVVDGIDHELHLGDHGHREKIGLELSAGSPATATGFVYRQEGADGVDMAVSTLETGGREYRFRSDDGAPLWRGRTGGFGEGKGMAGRGEG